MFLRKYWIPFSVLLIVIACIGVYLLVTQPPKEPIVIYKAVEPLPESERQTEAPVVSEAPQGHFHADGTWHAGPHEVEIPVETPAAPEPFFSEAELAAIPEDMPEPDIPLPDDLVDAKDFSRFMQKHTVEWQKYIHALNPRIERLSKEIDQMMEELPPENSPDFAAAKAKLRAKEDEHHKLGVEKNARIHQAVASAQKFFEEILNRVNAERTKRK